MSRNKNCIFCAFFYLVNTRRIVKDKAFSFGIAQILRRNALVKAIHYISIYLKISCRDWVCFIKLMNSKSPLNNQIPKEI